MELCVNSNDCYAIVIEKIATPIRMYKLILFYNVIKTYKYNNYLNKTYIL